MGAEEMEEEELEELSEELLMDLLTAEELAMVYELLE